MQCIMIPCVYMHAALPVTPSCQLCMLMHAGPLLAVAVAMGHAAAHHVRVPRPAMCMRTTAVDRVHVVMQRLVVVLAIAPTLAGACLRAAQAVRSMASRGTFAGPR